MLHVYISLSGALILESINPKYDNRLFVELQEKYKLNIYYVHQIVLTSECQSKNKQTIWSTYTTCTDFLVKNQLAISCQIVANMSKL